MTLYRRGSQCRIIELRNMSYLYKPFACIQSRQEIPSEEGTMSEGGIWHDLPDIGCPSQVIVMHEKRHLIVTAGRGVTERKEWIG